MENLDAAVGRIAMLASTAMAVLIVGSAVNRSMGGSLGPRLAAWWATTPAHPARRLPSPQEVSALLSEAQRYTQEAAPDG